METVVSKYSKPKATVTRRPLLTSKPPYSPAKDAGKISRISTFFFTTWPSAMLTKVRVNKIQCFIGSKVPPTESKTLFSWQYHALLLILVHLRLFTFISLFGSAPGKNNNKTLPSVDFSAVNFNERSLEFFINIWFD